MEIDKIINPLFITVPDNGKLSLSVYNDENGGGDQNVGASVTIKKIT